MQTTFTRICAIYIPLIFLSCDWKASAPSFSLPEFSTHRSIQLSDYSGKTRLVVFWATWCAPCLSEIPILNELQKELGPNGFQVIGINIDTDRDTNFSTKLSHIGFQFPVLLGDSTTILDYGNFQEIPRSFLIDREGVIQKQYEGTIPMDSLFSDIHTTQGLGRSTMMEF